MCGCGVEVCGRLVGEEDSGAIGNGAGDGDALLLADRELVGARGKAVGKSHSLQHLPRTLASPARRDGPGKPHAYKYVLERSKGGEQVECLVDEAEVLAAESVGLFVRECVNANTGHFDFTGVGFEET